MPGDGSWDEVLTSTRGLPGGDGNALKLHHGAGHTTLKYTNNQRIVSC